MRVDQASQSRLVPVPSQKSCTPQAHPGKVSTRFLANRVPREQGRSKIRGVALWTHCGVTHWQCGTGVLIY